MTVADHPEPAGLERVSAFSDGVYAIAITLLILPLTELRIRDDHVAEDLIAGREQFLAFMLSFAVIGRFWLVHHEDLRRMSGVVPRVMVSNLVALFFVVFLPFPTSLLADGGGSTATVVYALSIIGASAAEFGLWRSAERAGVVAGAMTSWSRRRYIGTLALVLAFLPSLGIAMVSPGWARASWLLAFPFGLFADHLRARRSSR